MEELDKTYQPKEVEERIYQRWERGGFFKPEINPDGEPFCIIMPPPNANGSLHLGHAVFVTLEDIMTRFARMNGKAALWLPGADHAGFETQVVFEKKLEKQGKSRFQIERDELYKMMWDFTQENKKVMEGQLRKLGASCDWDREKFTLDEDIKKLVHKTFKKMYDDGLVYRAARLVNWCPKHQTSLSELEVKYVEREDPLYYIKYGPLMLATVRPETKFGDTALAVNPSDKRYQQYIGKEIKAQGLLGEVTFKVIGDEAVDPKFGTGVVKVTPAHDPVDYEMWLRHKEEMPGPIVVIDERGKLTEVAGKYAGLKVEEARQIIAEDMKKLGILEKVDEHYKHTIATCYKCGRTIEPLPREQWYVAMTKKGEKSGKALAPDALKAVKEGKVKFIPKRFEKIFNYWLNNIRDWNISRQIVWGIRIPAWYCGGGNCGEIIVTDGEKPEKCPKCGNNHLIQDTDVFDTWFSSGQWPVVTLQSLDDKNQTNDFGKFYPTTVMETGADILFFWVARMIMFGLYLTDEVPFENVYLHGMVRDKDRQKMSKSKGNVIDPLGVAEEYGTDAVRMALVFGTGAGSDVVISEDKIRGMRNFANKTWNISRFILMNQDETEFELPKGKLKGKTEQDERILSELDTVVKSVTKHYEHFRFSQAGEELYEFVWHKLADVYIEAAKDQLQNEKLRKCTQEILIYVLATSLQLLHPIMPIITEEIYSKMFSDKNPIIVSRWPR